MDVTIPEIAENVDIAEVGRILVSVGDAVTADQPLMELEADKASFELPSPVAGRVEEIHVETGDEVKVGQCAVTVVDEDAPSKDASADHDDDSVDETRAEASEREQDEDEQDEDEKRNEAAEDEPNEQDEDERDEDEDEQDEDERDEDERDEPESDESAPTAASSHRRSPPRAAPTTRKLARELGIDLDAVEPGSDGRITKDAVKAYVRRQRENESSANAEVRVERLSRTRRTAAERLTRAWREIPHVTQHELADVTALERARQHYDADRGDGDPKLTLGTLVAYACITTLRSFPTFNSHFDADSAEVKTSSRVHLGLAVDTERGLLVPVVENADRLSLRELALRMVDLAAKARAGELEAQELRGSTFTLTNLGGIGGRFFTPIVNPPEVAILGAGRAFLERDQEGDESVRLPLSLSYDHRVIDGAHGARFITAVAHKLRNALAVAL